VRTLRKNRFGCLQKSVWITPDPVLALAQLLHHDDARARSLVLLDALPCGGENHAELVRTAWNWAAINNHYGECLRFLEQIPRSAAAGDRLAVRGWLTQERSAWKEACILDPFVPEALLPPDYLGRKAWAMRCVVLPQILHSCL
jgi:DNA-binding transcriptional regulator PaaX